MTRSSDIAVIIPHYNDVVRLVRCLTALHSQIDESVEVVVVDNCSTESLDLVRYTWPQLTIVVEPSKGAANARNRGVEFTSAPKLVFLDADCVPAADWLKTARTLVGDHLIFGGRIEVFDESVPPRSGAEVFEAIFAFDQKTYIEKKGFSVTACLLTSRDIFEQTGNFRQGVSEDLDWCRRACSLGATLVYVKDWYVFHPSRSDWSALKRKWRRLSDESFQLDGVNARVGWAVLALAMPLSALVHLPKILAYPGLNFQERLGGAGVLIGIRSQRMIWMLTQSFKGRALGDGDEN